jgi:hypothetical protein
LEFSFFDSFLSFDWEIGVGSPDSLSPLLSLVFPVAVLFYFFVQANSPTKIKNKNGKESNAQKLSVQFDGHHLFVKL